MLYIMRHGRTDWNVRHKLQGRTDIPLNDEGRMMAAEAGAHKFCTQNTGCLVGVGFKALPAAARHR